MVMMGHFIPRSVHDDGNGYWNLDPGNLDAILPALTGADITYNSTTSAPVTSAPAPPQRAVAAASEPVPVLTKAPSTVSRPHFAETANEKVDVHTWMSSPTSSVTGRQRGELEDVK